ncbi:PAS domain-containing protein, partial [Haemophilus parainfluenzae]|uniref:PAS domain-containing protein n=1 Tax=Haemophilus parainfluenzae TaxID=729 RepID=UPI001CED4555
MTTSNRVVLERMHPEDRPGFLATLAQGIAQPGVYSYEWRILLPHPGSDPAAMAAQAGQEVAPTWIRAIARTEHRSAGAVCWHGVALNI